MAAHQRRTWGSGVVVSVVGRAVSGKTRRVPVPRVLKREEGARSARKSKQQNEEPCASSMLLQTPLHRKQTEP